MKKWLVGEDGMMKAKAVCVMRTDLRNSDGFKVPKGKLIAQGGHAFVGLLLRELRSDTPDDKSEKMLEHYLVEGTALCDWVTGIFTKVVLAADSEEELLDIYSKAQLAGLNTVLITDAGHTEFSEPTNTCIGIGPDWEYNIDIVTGHLKGFS
jgi:peptidyl-tRNA hydrolase